MSLSKQQIFDRVSKHLLTQNAKSKNNILCRYRSENGLKCAVGCLIPDELYSTKMETLPVLELIRLSPAVERILGAQNEMLLTALQNIHDYVDVKEWKKHLLDLAKLKYLNPKVLHDPSTL